MAEDLDALAVEPLIIKVGGQEYTVTVTVQTMMRIARETDADAAANTIGLVMEACGMPQETFNNLNPAQAARLTTLITERFFGGAPVDTETETESAVPSAGPTP